MIFGYGSVMLEAFGAVFLVVAIVLLVGDAKVGRRKKDLRDWIADFGEADGRVRPTAESD